MENLTAKTSEPAVCAAWQPHGSNVFFVHDGAADTAAAFFERFAQHGAKITFLDIKF